MKISFVLPGYHTVPSGGFQVVYKYANGLVSKGHNISVIHPYSLVSESGLSDGTISFPQRLWRTFLHWQRSTRPAPLNWQHIDPRVNMVYLRNASAYDLIPNGDVIIATGWETASFVWQAPAMKGHKFHYIADFEQWIGSDSDTRELMKQSFTLPLSKIAMSRASAQMIRECTSSTADIPIIPLAIEHDTFYVRNPIQLRNTPIVGMPYRIAKYKGVDNGLEAIRMVRNATPNLRLKLFGSAPLQHTLDPWMEYIQAPTNQEIAEIYNSTSIFVVPSWAEGWGLPGMEAIACGAALCSTDTGGVQEYAIHSQTALISPPRQPDRLAENILLLLKNNDLRYSIAERGVEAIQEFTWEHCAEVFEMTITKMYGEEKKREFYAAAR